LETGAQSKNDQAPPVQRHGCAFNRELVAYSSRLWALVHMDCSPLRLLDVQVLVLSRSEFTFEVILSRSEFMQTVRCINTCPNVRSSKHNAEEQNTFKAAWVVCATVSGFVVLMSTFRTWTLPVRRPMRQPLAFGRDAGPQAVVRKDKQLNISTSGHSFPIS
jgi:hypothetical protein